METNQHLLDAWRIDLDFDNLQWRNESRSGFVVWEERREQRKRELAFRDRTFFGTELWGASAAHHSAKTRIELLQKHGLPILRSEAELAKWLGISLHRLRYFTHDKAADTVWHYIKYTIPKRSGGQRVILAPKTELKAIQRKILHDLLDKLQPHKAAHGFIGGRSIVTNAKPHVSKAYVLRVDLKDFFPTISYQRIRGLFLMWGYSFSVASTLALLCTEYDREPFQRNDIQYWISTGQRALVQGAPTSPALANLIAWKLDQTLQILTERRHVVYTRYADDLTFSSDNLKILLYILGEVPHIVTAQGFCINRDKTRLMRRSTRQTVTGLVVNDKVSVSRTVRRQIRAVLHNAQRTGLTAQNRDNHSDFRAYLQGMIGFIAETNPQEAKQLSAILRTIW